tara:strand:+ start:21789 stop:22367 length:579 start_codon:yes stop_codon:yes gene_type:complete
MNMINRATPEFKTMAFHNNGYIEVSNETFKGHWSVVIFMPAAFTYNCPTEVEDAATNYSTFQNMDSEVYVVTTDTHHSHKMWHQTSDSVGKAQFPLIGDKGHDMAKGFGVFIDDPDDEDYGLTLRGTFIIDPDGVIKTCEIHSNEIARDVDETIRKLKAAQYTRAHPNEVCPAKWKDGEKTLEPSFDLTGKI